MDSAQLVSFSNVVERNLLMPNNYLTSLGINMTEASIIDLLGKESVLQPSQITKRLGLDAGYVSRLLKSFEAKEWVFKRESPEDKRSRDVVLSPKGRKLYEHLLQSREEAAEAIMGQLSESQRKALGRAAETIERLFGARAPLSGIAYRPPRSGEIGHVVGRLAALYHEAYGWDSKFEALLHHMADRFIMQFRPEREAAWVAEYDSEIVGFVALDEDEAQLGQLLLLYVEPHMRRKGIARRLIGKAEDFARAKGYRTVRLWGNDVQAEGRILCEALGYQRTQQMPHDQYGEELVAEAWEKTFGD